MGETQVQPLGWEDPLEKEMATHSSTLAWKIPWTEETGGLQSVGSQRGERDWATSLCTFVPVSQARLLSGCLWVDWGLTSKDHEGTFWGDENTQYLDKGLSYKNAYTCQKSECSLTSWAFLCFILKDCQ